MTLAVKHMPGKGKRFVERIYRLRVIGLALGFFCVASVFQKQDRGPLLWGLLVFHGFIWPHVARRAAHASSIPYRGEQANLLIDALFGGFWVAAMRFNVLPSAVILVMLSMDNMAAGGLTLFAWGLVCHVAGLLVGLAVVGYAFEPMSHMSTILACLPFLIAYPLVLGWSMHRISQQLAQQTRSLEQLSRTDGLTGLLNRRTWENLLAAEFAQCRTAGWTSSLLLIDLDHFKRINDTYGHPTGDAVLKTLAGMLREHFHDSDCIGRYGGEEFGVVLRGTTLSIASGAAERLVAAVRQNAQGDNPSFPCTLSIGVAQFDPAMRHHVEWLQKADANLYAAKLGGRDRVVIANETASTS
ncbi:diguanylate cyclase AdrA [Paraburkholderia monticola]|uniref:diguanylate cyclase n=1 Tax=Paraburkholderia monticola TaxID=1399968 RepID=A0A149PMJ8_9BURK|nr:diguanylate cyclase [Paraburkholderia monticola]KXU86271.1 diguanylate cyclase AdrA [Paraburkholderia monticola]